MALKLVITRTELAGAREVSFELKREKPMTEVRYQRAMDAICELIVADQGDAPSSEDEG